MTDQPTPEAVLALAATTFGDALMRQLDQGQALLLVVDAVWSVAVEAAEKTALSARERGVAEGRRQATEGYAVPEHLVGDGPCCQDCGTVNIRWYADSPLWNRVMGGPDARDDPGGIVCIRCFVIRADAAGHDPSAWRLTLPGTSLAREWGIRRPLDGVCVPYADERTAKDAAERTHRAARYGAASIVSRLVGPWEPTEQPAARELGVQEDNHG